MDLYKLNNLRVKECPECYLFVSTGVNGEGSVSTRYLSKALGISSAKLCAVMRKFYGCSVSGYTHFANKVNAEKAVEWINNAYMAKKLASI
jgi:hypothetical protein